MLLPPEDLPRLNMVLIVSEIRNLWLEAAIGMLFKEVNSEPDRP